MNRRPILITGSHRSGTTWVGRMLAHSPTVAYIHEPFNPQYYDPGICAARFHHHWSYLTPANEQPYLGPMRLTMALRYNWRAALPAMRRWFWYDAARISRDAWRFWQARRRGARALIKDPIAMFSAPWLANRFEASVVVLIRHPAAFVSSVKRFGWRSPIQTLLDQPALMAAYLSDYRDEMTHFANDDACTLVEQAAVLWKYLYHTIAQFQVSHPEWLYIRHEDLSLAPLAGFERIFAHVGVSLTPDIRATVEQYTSPDNQAEAPQNESVFKLDSRANIWNWAQRLDPAEIATIRRLTGAVGAQYYQDADWQPPAS